MKFSAHLLSDIQSILPRVNNSGSFLLQTVDISALLIAFANVGQATADGLPVKGLIFAAVCRWTREPRSTHE